MFEHAYPNKALWVKSYGWIEIGSDEYSASLVRVLDIGGLIWESDDRYATIDVALIACEQAIKAWMPANF